MLFTRFLYLSLAIFLIGTFFRLFSWLTINVGPQNAAPAVGVRIKAALKSSAKTIFSFKIFKVIKIIILDAILQVKVARQDFLRWLMHSLIFFGFIGLLLMHALDGMITEKFFSEYQSTLNPFLFLRNLMGFMVVAGIGLAIFRRLTIKRLRVTSNRMDVFTIIILAIILLSGFLLESSQIISEPVFNEMVADYMGSDDPEEIMPLKVYWAHHYGVVFNDPVETNNEQLLAQGSSLHEESCMACHHQPSAAFVSYTLSKMIAPWGSVLNRARLDLILWYIHFIACFTGLAYLPFSRLFHMISGPISLVACALYDNDDASEPAVLSTKRALARDACTHCGACSVHCSVAPVYQMLGNLDILPSEKLLSTFKMAARKSLDATAMAALSDASFICTDCYRCTAVCPSGIDLQDLWMASRKKLEENGFPSPYARLRKQNSQAATALSVKQQAVPLNKPSGNGNMMEWIEEDSFAACFECQTCTNACPVVAVYDNPGEVLKLLPHQIMHAVGLGLMDMALGTTMIWDCVTCYKCQEQCPQGVHVTEVLYMLKNMTWQEQANRNAVSGARAIA